MATEKPLESLTWSEASYTLIEFLETFGVPNMVSFQDGLLDAFALKDEEIFMLHGLRFKQNVIGEDSTGRFIAIPLRCKNKLLVCPLPEHYSFSRIYVSEMPHVYPDIKYFRVLGNDLEEETDCLKPGSILKIERIDSRNSTVKFVNVDRPLPSNSRVVFEPLLNFCEYTLNDVINLFGLPAKVRFLPETNVNPQVQNEYENFSNVSNLGKVTLIGLADQQTEVVATRIDTEPSLQLTGPVKCLQIPTDFTLNVLVATGLLKNDNEYFNMVRQLNETFLDKYDINALDGVEKYQYLDQPSGNAGVILQTVLVPKVYGDYHSNFDEFPPENCCKQGHETAAADNYVDMTSPVTSEDGYCTMTRGSPRHKSESEVSSQRVKGADSTTVTKSATFKPAYKVLLNVPVLLNLSALEVKRKRSTSEKMNETMELKDTGETSEKTLTSTDLCAESLKEDAEIVKPESAIEESSSTVSVPSISKDRDGIPADLASLSVEGVERLLRSLNMACYINKFRNEQIDGEILMELSEEELISLKVLPFHVVKLMKVISGWRPSV